MRISIVSILITLLLSTSLYSQTLPNHICKALTYERSKYPPTFVGLCDVAGDNSCPLGFILNTVAWQFRAEGWQLSRKDTGYYVISPAGPIASDILEKNQVMWDVFVNAGTWSTVDCGWPIGASHRPSVDPVGIPEDPCPDNTACETTVQQLNRIVYEMSEEHKHTTIAYNNALKEIERLKRVSCRARLFGIIPVPCSINYE
jgi:hypothetical protein